MTEQQGFNTVFSVLLVISIWCLYMLFNSSLEGYRDSNSIYALINMSVCWKFYFGLKKYESLAQKGILKRTGSNIIKYAFVRFY